MVRRTMLLRHVHAGVLGSSFGDPSERAMATAPHYDVVEQRTDEQRSRMSEAVGERDILRARRRISAGMIVHDDDARSPRSDGRSEHLPRMNQTRGERAARDLPPADRTPARIEHHHPKTFDGQ